MLERGRSCAPVNVLAKRRTDLSSFPMCIAYSSQSSPRLGSSNEDLSGGEELKTIETFAMHYMLYNTSLKQYPSSISKAEASSQRPKSDKACDIAKAEQVSPPKDSGVG